MKKNNKWLLKNLFLLMMVLSVSYAQEIRTVNFKTGSIQTYVDIYRGNFSVYDVEQLDMDFVSFLFGGSTTPSSFFKVFIDRKPQTLDQMEVKYPLGVSLGSQIDGTFLAGEDADVQVDVAFFALDVANSDELSSIGLVINLSNTSVGKSRRVGAKIMLDTDLGESRNDPLAYLPTGEKITNSFIFGENNIPPFLFIGQKDLAETRPIGKGFYLYPYLSQNKPTSMIVANWRRLVEQNWNINRINPSFAYKKDSTKDMGISLCFGDIVLKSQQSEYFGFVISKNFTDVWPVVQEESISKGVLSEERFEVEELLKHSQPNSIRKSLAINETMSDNPYVLFQRKREQYRLQQLLNQEQNNQESLEKMTNLMANDSIWKVIYQLDWDIKKKSEDINKIISNNTPHNSDDKQLNRKLFRY